MLVKALKVSRICEIALIHLLTLSICTSKAEHHEHWTLSLADGIDGGSKVSQIQLILQKINNKLNMYMYMRGADIAIDPFGKDLLANAPRPAPSIKLVPSLMWSMHIPFFLSQSILCGMKFASVAPPLRIRSKSCKMEGYLGRTLRESSCNTSVLHRCSKSIHWASITSGFALWNCTNPSISLSSFESSPAVGWSAHLNHSSSALTKSSSPGLTRDRASYCSPW